MNAAPMAQPPYQVGARGPKNGPNSHYRRARSPELDEYRPGDEEPLSPTSDIALQDAMLAQAQHQQRVVPIGQPARNPATRRRGSPPKSQQPPSYPGVSLDDAPAPQNPPNVPRNGHYRRQSGPPQRRASGSDQPPPPPPPAGPPGPNPQAGSPRTNGNMPNRRPQSMAMDQPQRRPPHEDPSTSGLSINRLNSPSITKTVLQPLEQKMQEYNQLMEDAHNQMLHLDEELRAMQERRREAEARFLEAKAKHDEYGRQHADVGRALRGEVERPITPRAIPRMESVESFDQRPVSNQSSKMQKSRGRDRLRMSIFKSL